MARRRLTFPGGESGGAGAPPDLAAARALAAALPDDLEVKAFVTRGPRPPGAPVQPIPRAPIARVAGEAAAEAALAEVAGELAAARAEGRMVVRLALDAVDAGYLLRDRIAADADETAALRESLRLHGQRMPVEVADLGGGRYGLIAGWRRLTALRALHAETGEARFATVAALVRQPATAAEAYVAMVEENEIRAGLSYWERGRIAVRAVEAGVFPDERTALQRLYAAASRARRSKIGSFAALVRALDGVLAFPAALPERQGLALAQALAADPGVAGRLAARLAADPPGSAEAERAAIAAVLAPPRAAPASGAAVAPGLTLRAEPGRIVLAGPAADAGLAARLRAFLAAGLDAGGDAGGAGGAR